MYIIKHRENFHVLSVDADSRRGIVFNKDQVIVRLKMLPDNDRKSYEVFEISPRRLVEETVYNII